jgi:hypothetical protein
MRKAQHQRQWSKQPFQRPALRAAVRCRPIVRLEPTIPSARKRASGLGLNPPPR